MTSKNNPFPIRLKQARLAFGIPQKELGIKVGMDESNASGKMNHYEKGRHMPDIELSKKIAKALNVPLSFFYCEDEMSAEIARLADMLDDEGKQLIIKAIKARIEELK